MKLNIELNTDGDSKSMISAVLMALTGRGVTEPAQPADELVAEDKPRRGRPPKAKSEETGAPEAQQADRGTAPRNTEELLAINDAARRASEQVSEPAAAEQVIDAGTGQPAPLAEVDRNEVKAQATLLTQRAGGNAQLKDLFVKYGAAKFSDIGDDQLAAFHADIGAALAA